MITSTLDPMDAADAASGDVFDLDLRIEAGPVEAQGAWSVSSCICISSTTQAGNC
ncbi:FDLD family class I lanthipeptide [Streptomyces sp. NPDC050095]|uniref:FDLD family class I lanthipeptide n=1 Tax=unclassified Streptomyces TaxID=2593676 RepID=UPI00342A3772